MGKKISEFVSGKHGYPLLYHYADQHIKLNLDDGVKVNYGKFGNLLAEVNAIIEKIKGNKAECASH